MTLLNEKPIKGMALNFQGKWQKASWWYVLLGGSGYLCSIVDWKGMGLGGACILEDKKGKIVASGYFCDIKNVKPYKKELNRNKRGL